jgi:hypothetical protein
MQRCGKASIAVGLAHSKDISRGNMSDRHDRLNYLLRSVEVLLVGVYLRRIGQRGEAQVVLGAEASVRCVAALRVLIAIPPQVPDLAHVAAVVIESYC